MINLSVGSIGHMCGIIYISEFTYIHIYTHIRCKIFFFFLFFFAHPHIWMF